MEKSYKFWIGAIFSAVFLYLVVKDVPFHKSIKVLSTIRWQYLLPAVFFFLLGYAFKVLRWFLLLKSASGKMTFRETRPPFFIGFAVNNVLPLRIGELVRTYLIGNTGKVSKSAGFGSVVLDRVFDGLSLVFLLAVSLIWLPLPGWVTKMGFLSALLFLGSLGFLLLIFYAKEKTLNLIGYLGDRAVAISESFISGLESVRSIKMVSICFVFSILVWVLESLMYYYIGVAFNLALSLIGAILVLVILNFGLFVPSSPGYVGTFEFFCMKALGIFNVDASVALNYAIVLHLAQHIPITIIGFIYLWKENLTLSVLKRKATKSQ